MMMDGSSDQFIGIVIGMSFIAAGMMMMMMSGPG